MNAPPGTVHGRKIVHSSQKKRYCSCPQIPIRRQSLSGLRYFSLQSHRSFHEDGCEIVSEHSLFNSLMQYVCTLSKSDYQFTKFDYVCLRAIFQDHYVMAFPSIHLFLAGNYRLLNTHLLELVNRFSNNPIIQRRCIHIIINLMETARIIDSHQVSQLHGLCQSNDPKMYSQFLLFREKSDISAFFNCMKNRITASPLQPPRCSLRLSQSSWSNIPHADFALVQSGIRVIAMREGGKISSEECLNRLYRLLHPSGSSDVSIGDRELSFSFFVPSQMDYPRNELYQLIRMGAFSTNEQSYLYYKCRESSLSLALCYCSYAQTGNQSQFDELCKMCMENPIPKYCDPY